MQLKDKCFGDDIKHVLKKILKQRFSDVCWLCFGGRGVQKTHPWIDPDEISQTSGKNLKNAKTT